MNTFPTLRSLALVMLMSTTAFAAETQTLYHPMEIWCAFFPEDDAGSKQAVEIIDSCMPSG